MASTFKPKLGMEKEWITSVEVIKRREVVLMGRSKLEVEERRRGLSLAFIITSSSKFFITRPLLVKKRFRNKGAI